MVSARTLQTLQAVIRTFLLYNVAVAALILGQFLPAIWLIYFAFAFFINHFLLWQLFDSGHLMIGCAVLAYLSPGAVWLPDEVKGKHLLCDKKGDRHHQWCQLKGTSRYRSPQA